MKDHGRIVDWDPKKEEGVVEITKKSQNKKYTCSGSDLIPRPAPGQNLHGEEVTDIRIGDSSTIISARRTNSSKAKATQKDENAVGRENNRKRRGSRGKTKG